MSDIHSKEQRSKNMAAVRSTGNKTTELRMTRLFREYHIRGWRRHSKVVAGKPDFVFPHKKLAVFVDGCFWHGCTVCRSLPKSNRTFWRKKIERNIERDREVNKALKSSGWRVLRIKEHQLKHSNRVIARITKQLVTQ